MSTLAEPVDIVIGVDNHRDTHDGRFKVVVDGELGLITTFQNLSQKSLDRLAKNYGWVAG